MTKLPSKLIVRVTARDIKNGKPRKPCRCPIALAVRRKVGPLWRLSADYGYTTVKAKRPTVNQSRQYSTPKMATRFMSKFDGRRPVKPATFTFRLSPREL